MSYLQNHTDFTFDGKNMKIVFNNKDIFEGTMTNPFIIKLVFEDNKIFDIKCIK